MIIHDKENLNSPDSIRTFTGLYMNVFVPTLEMIEIEDIVHGISVQPRFSGQLAHFYSVAQHSIWCVERAQESGLSNALQFQCLMHDASEAYLMDIPSPIKARFPFYKEIENGLMLKIAEKFGFDYPLNETVKEIDLNALKWEWEYLMLKRQNKKVFPEYIKEEFMYHFRRLRNPF